MSTAFREAWKRITFALDRDIEVGLVAFSQLRVKDLETANKVARNLDSFNLFLGETVTAELFLRVASTTESADASILQEWSKCLVLVGKVKEAASVQARAIKMDASMASSPSLAEWLKSAEADLKEESPVSRTVVRLVGNYGSYKLELDSGGHLVLVTPIGRRPLAQLRSGGFLSRDLAYFKDDNALITMAGQSTEKLKRSGT